MLREFNQIGELNNYIASIRLKKLHPESFLDTLNLLIKFVNESRKIYEKEEGIEKVITSYLAQVANSIMGAGKTTALEIVGKMAIEKKVPLLCIFNNKDTMDNYFKSVEQFANEHGYSDVVIQVHDKNYYDVVHKLSEYTIVAMTQQRFRDIALGYGEFNPLKSYNPKEKVGWGAKQNRVIIIDEMPEFIDGEVFDLGDINNCLDWFDAMTRNISEYDINPSDIRKTRLIINHLFANEFTEVQGDDNTSLSSRRLIRFIEGSQQEQLLNKVLALLNVEVNNEYKNRFKWFKRLLKESGTGVVNHDDKTTSLICSELINYHRFGNVLILDGTADITETIYNHAGFNLLKLTNYHNYEERLSLHFKNINTSKESRKGLEVHSKIDADIDDLRKKGLDIFPLPAKQDIQVYKQLGTITKDQFQKFYVGRDREDVNGHEAMALNLLNTTGKNDIAHYDYLGLLTLPARHPNYYKLFAVAIFSTSKNISLNLKSRGRQDKESIKWFQDEEVQEIYEKLMLMELSQIIHRSSLRYMKLTNEVNIYIYTNKLGWLEELKILFNISREKTFIHPLFLTERFKQDCKEKAEEVYQIIQKKIQKDITQWEFNPISISMSFKKWLNSNWSNEERKKIIEEIFREKEIAIVEYGRKNYKKIVCL
ncbi:hypothetical protein JQN58_15450 [Aneurinibacillus sp. BA2021]|nr:hypothetical protein [Aneurinibacillus sp. BA2021]